MFGYMPESIDHKTVFSLLEVSRSIQKTISDRYQSLYWVKAEMNKLNHYAHSGHCFPELVEKKDGKVVAETRSILWKADYTRINQQFIELLQEPLRDGITILFQAGISYDPLYGLSLRIVDIDPAFVLGELEKEKKESLRRLQAEGVFQLNKQLRLARLPKRLAIISVETSKGLSDFNKIITQNPWGYRLEMTLFPALLQGDRSIPSIIGQLANIAERADAYDAVAIIRGGGGEVGLSSYNNYQLAKAICIFPLPVLTGIGHSTNETVSELVSYKNAITPSELADFLLQRFHDFAIPLDRLLERMIDSGQRRFDHEKQALKQISQALSWQSQQRLQKHLLLLQDVTQRLDRSSRQAIRVQHTALQHLSQLIQLSDPKHLLRRGFSITRINGKAIQSTEALHVGDVIQTEVLDGHFTSTIKEIKHGK
ncbi:exodeoxyribonuclease VII large subunit [Sphingobacterium sp. lm-10]|uniref:exodeoxyribonuclease VII large subunit n=1 Tax=Sphingobacterium sp. lm-10 TaxID=2944904 RepID=UPI0020206E6C|nr:exodeoxyribonuclease VII large subunit [Sphingobacterium sp. lm-10]MCL7988386.1 exodeoxyribonuclease VII large subunit [Sphingobacterium sp. lm-10]